MTFGYNPYWISIISNVDSITILSTKINRGDCGGISRIDRKLGFGNSYEFRILPSFCRYVKEISVKIKGLGILHLLENDVMISTK